MGRRHLPHTGPDPWDPHRCLRWPRAWPRAAAVSKLYLRLLSSCGWLASRSRTLAFTRLRTLPCFSFPSSQFLPSASPRLTALQLPHLRRRRDRWAHHLLPLRPSPTAQEAHPSKLPLAFPGRRRRLQRSACDRDTTPSVILDTSVSIATHCTGGFGPAKAVRPQARLAYRGRARQASVSGLRGSLRESPQQHRWHHTTSKPCDAI